MERWRLKKHGIRADSTNSLEPIGARRLNSSHYASRTPRHAEGKRGDWESWEKAMNSGLNERGPPMHFRRVVHGQRATKHGSRSPFVALAALAWPPGGA
jgi:hypothetical protein